MNWTLFGMQPGEKQYRDRAAALMGGRGEAESEYLQRAEIGTSGPASRYEESVVGEQLATNDVGAIGRDEAKKRLRTLMMRLKVPEKGAMGQNRIMNGFDHPGFMGFGDDKYSTEELAGSAAQALTEREIPGGSLRGSSLSETEGNIRARNQEYKSIILGNGERGTVKDEPLKIQLKTQDGRNVPHQVEAAGISGR